MIGIKELEFNLLKIVRDEAWPDGYLVISDISIDTEFFGNQDYFITISGRYGSESYVKETNTAFKLEYSTKESIDYVRGMFTQLLYTNLDKTEE